MQILLAGGTNFIGRAIATRLSRHHDLAVLNRGSRPPVDGIARHLVADRNDPEALREIIAGSDAFDVVIDVSATEPSQVRGLLSGLADGLPHSYVLISSAAVYSPGAAPPVREESATEGDPVWGGYGEDKAACEDLVRASGVQEVTILRPPYIYGPENNEDREKWLWARMAAGRPVFVPTDGQASIQFCHVDYLASVVEAVVEGRLAAGTYNVGTDPAVTFEDFIAVLSDVSGHPARVVPVGDPRVPARRYFPFRDIDLVLDVGKLRRSGMPEGPNLRSGLEQTWAWLTEVGIPPYVPTEQEVSWTEDVTSFGHDQVV